MTRHIVAPARPGPWRKSSQWPASRAICILNRTIFRHDLLAPDSIGGFLDDLPGRRHAVVERSLLLWPG